MTTSAPRPSCTLILVRDDPRFEVFMVRRNAHSRFMADRYVYVGGKHDVADDAPAWDELTTGRSLSQCRDVFEDDMASGRARGLFITAIREAFEEAGVLIARHEDGTWAHLDAHDEGWLADRRAVFEDATLFDEAMRSRGLKLDLAHLHYVAHWITPPFEARRYDTRFFLARSPLGQTPMHDDVEVTDGQWWTPGGIIDAYARGELMLAPPTLRTLWDLARCDNVDQALRWAAEIQPVPILPELDAARDTPSLVLPGNPVHSSGNVSPPPTRIELRDQRWTLLDD